MVSSDYRSRRQVRAADRITQAVRPIVEVAVLLVSGVVVGAVLIAALVWTLWTLGLVLA